MKLLVGLGNPGAKYQNNRHNVGHLFVDYIVDKFKSGYPKFKAVKTDVFMNQSGVFVKKTLSHLVFSISDLIVVHDDLDIPLGKFKIQQGEGPRLHNGLNSIEKILGIKDFWRIRIGVDQRNAEKWIDGETYVLSNFTPTEKKVVEDLFPKIYDKLYSIG